MNYNGSLLLKNIYAKKLSEDFDGWFFSEDAYDKDVIIVTDKKTRTKCFKIKLINVLHKEYKEKIYSHLKRNFQKICSNLD